MHWSLPLSKALRRRFLAVFMANSTFQFALGLLLVRCSNSPVPANFWKLSDVNWGPLSLMTWSGHPYLAKWLFNLQSSYPNSLTAWNRYADSPARMSSGVGHRSKKLPFKKYRNSSHKRRLSATTTLLVSYSYPMRCQSKGTRRGLPPRSEACSVLLH